MEGNCSHNFYSKYRLIVLRIKFCIGKEVRVGFRRRATIPAEYRRVVDL